MSRRPRLLMPGAIYHVHSRGVRRLPIFEDDDDRHCFWNVVDEASDRYHLKIQAACQMGNHYHLVLETPRGNLSEGIQFLNSAYSQRANRRHGRTGHLFEGPFDGRIVQRGSYFRRLCRYVVLNPVKARLVRTAGDWRWSTYQATAGLAEAPRWLDTTWLERVFEATTRGEAQERYREYVNRRNAERDRLIRKHSAVIGSPAFRAKMKVAAENQSDELLVPKAALPQRKDLASIFADTEYQDRYARVYEAHVTHGYFLTEIAAFLGVHRTRVSRALRHHFAVTRSEG